MIEDHAFPKEVHDIRHAYAVLSLHLLPAESVGENVQHKFSAPQTMAKDNRCADGEGQLRTNRHRLLNAVEVELRFTEQHRPLQILRLEMQ